jgi:PTS system mannose-specific IIC component
VGLGVAVFYELFWLDLIPAGTYIPPSGLLATMLVFGVSHFFDLHTASELAIPLFLALPLAHLAAQLEHRQRKWQDGSYNALLQWARRAHLESAVSRPERLVAGSLVQIFVLHFLIFVTGLACLLSLYYGLRVWFSPAALRLPVTWPHLWFLAGIGGIVGLRLKKSIMVFAVAVAVIAVTRLL